MCWDKMAERAFIEAAPFLLEAFRGNPVANDSKFGILAL
jgi:hypothetical protein